MHKNIYILLLILTKFKNHLTNPIPTYRSLCQPPSSCMEIWKCPDYFKLFHEARGDKKSVIRLVRKNFCGVNKNIPEVCCSVRVKNISDGQKVDESKNVDDANFSFLPLNVCGKITNGLRITSGVNSSPGEFPWMALIAYKNGQDSQDEDFRCGGTVISERYVLTAAHCINPSILGVRLGEYNTASVIDCDESGLNCEPPVQDLLISKAIKHPLYDSKTLENDIALIRLATSANFSRSNVKPICLPVGALAKKSLTGRRLTVTGWGVTEKGEKSSTLRKVSIPVLSLKDCQSIYQAFKPITANQICAGAYKGRDSCEGDSGGPLKAVDVVNDSPRYVQFGVVSYGPKHCGIDGRPGVYTNVAKYIKWILDIINL